MRHLERGRGEAVTAVAKLSTPRDRGGMIVRSWQVLALGIVTVILAVSTTTAVAGETLTLRVEGLTETGCSSPPAVQGTAKRFPEVREARVSLERGEMTLDYEGDRAKLEEVLSTVERMCQVKVIRSQAR